MVGNNPATKSTFHDKDTEGWPGAIIDEVAAKMRISMPRNRPNIATILCGTNDMSRNIDVGNAPRRMGRLIDDLLNFPPLTLVVLSSLPPHRDATINASIRAFNAALPAVVDARVRAGRSVIFADCGRVVSVSDLPDGIHPNDKAFERIGKCFYDAIVAAERRGWLFNVQGPAP